MLCVIAKLDDAATNKLLQLQSAASPVGADLRPLYGHITVATYIGDDESCFIRSCKQLLKGFGAFEVVFDKIEVLEETSILVATPVKSESLLSLHQRIAKMFNDSLNQWTKKDDWYPHTTLLFGPRLDLHGICQKLADSFVPFPAKICKIEFSRVCENTCEIVDFMDLSRR